MIMTKDIASDKGYYDLTAVIQRLRSCYQIPSILGTNAVSSRPSNGKHWIQLRIPVND